MISSIISRLVILVFGTLYPAYASYKAVRTKNLKEYVKWMMYWIVFALFTCTETFTDVFLSWFPFYYEVKIVLVLWLLSPATKGSSILYRKFVHPALCRREQEIDEYIAKAKDQGYHTVLNLGTKGVNYATTVIMQTAIKGGGGLVQQLRKSYSLSDLSECEPREERGADEADDVLAEPRLIRRVVKSGYATRRSASESNSRTPMYFPEVDVDVRPARSRMDEPDFSHIKSTEDISSGYSSADNSAVSLTRTGSVGAATRTRVRSSRTTVTTIKRPQAAEDIGVTIEELHDDDNFVDDFTNMPPLVNVRSPLFLSHTVPPFLYQYVGDQVKIIQVLGNYPLRDESDLIDNRDQIIDTAEKSDDNFTVSTEGFSDSPMSETDINAIIINKDINIPKQNQSKEDIEIYEEAVSNQRKESVPELYTTPDREYGNASDTNNNKDDEISSLDALANDSYSAESDDEASFGTPENSPKTNKKLAKGKYGKNKAPLPPTANNSLLTTEKDISKSSQELSKNELSKKIGQESLEDPNKKIPLQNNEQITKELQASSLTVHQKEVQKGKHNKSSKNNDSNSGLGKLLQLPSKLAFWHKEEKSKVDDASSTSDNKSVSSVPDEDTVDFNLDEPSECKLPEKSDDQISFKDADDFDNVIVGQAQDVISKSDALQKVIEAKLESHPEYKLSVSHEEITTMSKSTDV